ncbi:MAG: class B sortase [Lachnospiraceae bacterium]|jgi:SrtB family sortase|nr:class B sortase [Lachnospiraceae bacterium]
MKKHWRIILIAVVILSFGIAVSYPIMYRMAETENNTSVERLSEMRKKVLEDGAVTVFDGSVPEKIEEGEEEEPSVIDGAKASPELESGTETAADTSVSGAELPGEEKEIDSADLTIEDLILDYVPGMKWRQVEIPELEYIEAPVSIARERVVAENRDVRTDPESYDDKEKVTFDKSKILPELADIYEINTDLIGWLSIEGTEIDYPVVQCEDSNFYLEHDFNKEENRNGQIILDTKCDPFTPSYNLIISGHHMRNGSMFGKLPLYSDSEYWREHKFAEFDSLMERKQYVIFAAFYSADYDEYEEGFRYNADIRYKMEADQWLEEIRQNQIYDTGIDAQFGDEFITLTTCERSRRQDGRFVVVMRRIREGETFDE